MPVRTLRIWPDECLKSAAQSFDFSIDSLEIVKDLIDTMIANFGAGIAAPQVGISQQIIVIDCSSLRVANPVPNLDDGKDFLIMINPEILELDLKTHDWAEGCLSVPGYSGVVRRSRTCRVSFSDQAQKQHVVQFAWPLAGVVQHEIDHLLGVTYIEKMINKRRAGRIRFDLYSRKFPTKSSLKRAKKRNRLLKNTEG